MGGMRQQTFLINYRSRTEGIHEVRHGSHLIDSKANGVHVLTMASVSAPVLLHEGYKETTRHLIILWVIILLQQCDLILRIYPKCVCRNGAFMSSQFCEKLHIL